MSEHLLRELKELKSICYEIIERINLLEKVFDEQRRDWNKKMNERLRKLDNKSAVFEDPEDYDD
jgi:nitrate/TMAO reductase-like tetraheme cytochrome c subunit